MHNSYSLETTFKSIFEISDDFKNFMKHAIEMQKKEEEIIKIQLVQHINSRSRNNYSFRQKNK